MKVNNIKDILPPCKERADGSVDEGMICKLSKHQCYWCDSSHIDCYCLCAAGICPKGKKLKKPFRDPLPKPKGRQHNCGNCGWPEGGKWKGKYTKEHCVPCKNGSHWKPIEARPVGKKAKK